MVGFILRAYNVIECLANWIMPFRCFLGVCLKMFNEGSLAMGASQDVLEEVQQ